jgi:ketosteroid isomerase-like protein
LVVAFLIGMIAPGLAQRAEIKAVNAKWTDFFNKGDFVGLASLYTENAIAFPPGAAMVKGRAAIGEMWKDTAEKVSRPNVTTLEVRPLGHLLLSRLGRSA